MRCLLLILAVIPGIYLQAQPLARHNLYPFNANFSNPACTGISTCLDITATDMHQWVGVANAPGIQSLSVQKGIPSSKYIKHGVGLNLIRDHNGPSKSFGGELLYSFHALIGKSHATWLSLGMSVNLEQRSLDERDFTPVYDPQITGGVEKELAFNASGGAYVYNEKFYAGIALYNLFPVNNNLSPGYGGDRYFTSFQAGYMFTPTHAAFRINTSFQGSLSANTKQFDLNNRLLLNNNLWTGITLRKYLNDYEASGQNVIIFIGYDWNRWRFAYDYNFDINKTRFHHYGTHQFSLGYRVCPNVNNCPAYR